MVKPSPFGVLTSEFDDVLFFSSSEVALVVKAVGVIRVVTELPMAAVEVSASVFASAVASF